MNIAMWNNFVAFVITYMLTINNLSYVSLKIALIKDSCDVVNTYINACRLAFRVDNNQLSMTYQTTVEAELRAFLFLFATRNLTLKVKDENRQINVFNHNLEHNPRHFLMTHRRNMSKYFFKITLYIYHSIEFSSNDTRKW